MTILEWRNSPENGLAALESEYFIDGVVVAATVVVVVAGVATGGVGADRSGESRANRLDLISSITNSITALLSQYIKLRSRNPSERSTLPIITVKLLVHLVGENSTRREVGKPTCGPPLRA